MVAGVGFAPCRKTPGPAGSEFVSNPESTDSGERRRTWSAFAPLDPWVKQVPFLVQLPGLGVLSALRLLAAIGDITRFPSAKHLVGYAGLGASVHQSGETSRGGRITKEGRSDLRGVMVEAAWVAVEHHPQRISPV